MCVYHQGQAGLDLSILVFPGSHHTQQIMDHFKIQQLLRNPFPRLGQQAVVYIGSEQSLLKLYISMDTPPLMCWVWAFSATLLILSRYVKQTHETVYTV